MLIYVIEMLKNCSDSFFRTKCRYPNAQIKLFGSFVSTEKLGS